ncbi:MAG: AAA family ATPase [Chloroflexota bacterium]|nr:AAA family ATPase [Chloroflexota bacterium]MDE2959039.1 AAA family ATPase [Chloroflexota bacterium]
MLIRRLKISGMLSFGPQGIDLPMEPLNVLIGPNGSGKSNFIEALALLQAAPRDLSAPVRRMGGISEWLWKGDDAPGLAGVDAVVNYPNGKMPLRHVLRIARRGERFEVMGETVEDQQPNAGETEPAFYYYVVGSSTVISETGDEPGYPRSERRIARSRLIPDASILSQREDPDLYPELGWLQDRYRQIRLYRNWEFGPDAGLRHSPRADEPSTFLTERGENLPLVLSKLRGDSRQKFVKSLQQLYDGIDNFHVEVGGGRAELFLVERGRGERYIPASRLSDGTLRYMALAAILLDPNPPPLVVIEEPELGLHPDVVLGIGEMLIQASERAQLVVTTHSRVLINALEDHVSSVVVCEKHDGESRFERLDPEYLSVWLDKYSLGYLWSTGEIRGNRW